MRKAGKRFAALAMTLAFALTGILIPRTNVRAEGTGTADNPIRLTLGQQETLNWSVTNDTTYSQYYTLNNQYMIFTTTEAGCINIKANKISGDWNDAEGFLLTNVDRPTENVINYSATDSVTSYNHSVGVPAGTYMITVSPYGGNTRIQPGETKTASMNCTVSFTAGNYEQEHDSSSIPTAIQSDTEYTGFVKYDHDYNDYDYYKFVLPTGTGRVYVSNRELFSGIYVTDPDGDKLVTSDGYSDLKSAFKFDASSNRYYCDLRSTAGAYIIRLEGGSTEAKYTLSVSPTTETENIYRLYNPGSGEHIFTTDLNEYNTLPSKGWRQEGVSWTSPYSSSTPVYRLYNPYSGDHHYTTDRNEYDSLPSLGWRQEGVAFYSDDNHSKPVYRLFNPNVTLGTHHFTTDSNEYSALPGYGWRQENICWYGM